MTIAQALAAARSLGVARLDAQLLLLHVLGRQPQERGWLLAHDEDRVDSTSAEAFHVLCRRRAAGEPLAYLVGEREFFGLRLKVDPRVLVPRPETETLVEWALQLLGLAGSPRVADLGTGSGAIALAIKKHCPRAQVEAVDASAAALEVAAANAQALGLQITLREACWLAAAPERHYDLIASNPPYVRAGDPHLAALAHEPLSALAAGADGLDDIRQIVARAPLHLRPGGWLLLEHGYDQALAVRALLGAAGFGQVQSRKDLAGIERCSGGQWLELG